MTRGGLLGEKRAVVTLHPSWALSAGLRRVVPACPMVGGCRRFVKKSRGEANIPGAYHGSETTGRSGRVREDFSRQQDWWDAKAPDEDLDRADGVVNRRLRWR